MFAIHFHEIKQVWGSRHVKAASSLGRCAEKPFNHGLVGSSLRFMPTAGPLAGALEEYLHKGYNIVEAALSESGTLLWTGWAQDKRAAHRQASTALMECRPASKSFASSTQSSMRMRVVSGPVSVVCARVKSSCRDSRLSCWRERAP